MQFIIRIKLTLNTANIRTMTARKTVPSIVEGARGKPELKIFRHPIGKTGDKTNTKNQEEKNTKNGTNTQPRWGYDDYNNIVF